MTMKRLTSGTGAILLLCCISLFGGIASADMVADGKKVSFDRKKGNCLSQERQLSSLSHDRRRLAAGKYRTTANRDEGPFSEQG
jgi:hypothetical protein